MNSSTRVGRDRSEERRRGLNLWTRGSRRGCSRPTPAWTTAATGLAAVVLVAFGCRPDASRRTAEDRARRVAGLMDLYETRDYWSLRDSLETAPELEGARISLLRAEVAHAFNRPGRSNQHLSELDPPEDPLPDNLEVRARLLRFRNHLRLFEYAAALEAARALLSLTGVDSTTRADVENEARAVAALADVPPQRVVHRGASELRRRPDTRVSVEIGDSVRGYVLDTGANLSVMMRSEAEQLGLQIREASVDVGTSTGSRLSADLAVAPHVRLGNVELAHVVFLVVPDEVLTFGPDFRIPGIIGFPVIDALGEVQFVGRDTIRIPEEVPERTVRNLAMDYLTPLVRIEVMGDAAVCELDTGADRSSLHRPFFDHHRERVRGEGRPDTIRTSGAGGERRIPGYVLSDVSILLGDTVASLADLPVYTESVSRGPGPAADCRLGLDVLGSFDGYLLNFRSMAFVPI